MKRHLDAGDIAIIAAPSLIALVNHMKGVQILDVDYTKVLDSQKPWQDRWTKEVQQGFNKQTGVTPP